MGALVVGGAAGVDVGLVVGAVEGAFVGLVDGEADPDGDADGDPAGVRDGVPDGFGDREVVAGAGDGDETLLTGGAPTASPSETWAPAREITNHTRVDPTATTSTQASTPATRRAASRRVRGTGLILAVLGRRGR
ncbi:MAG: hypothetical protein CMH83_22740 [Nocardioides sp.]|nr:hypothetical protein [Nocardioides sp.]